MNYIKNYKNYKNDRLVTEKYNRTIELLHDVQLSNDDLVLFRNIFEKILMNHKMEQSIRIEIENYVSSESLITEGFFDKLKERFPKAASVTNILSDAAEKALGGIINAAKDAVSFVKKIGESMKSFFISVIESGKKFYTEQLKSGKLKDKMNELLKGKKEGLLKDLKTIKEVVEFYRKDFMSKLLSSADKNMVDFLSKDQEAVVESMMINEGGNVIATLVHKIESIPPFSILHKIAQAGEVGSNMLIKSISDMTSKFGGPSFVLPVIALLIGVAIEIGIKTVVVGGGATANAAASGLIGLIGATTPLGTAIYGLKYTALFISIIIALDAVIGSLLLGGDHGDTHSTEVGHSTDDKEVDDSQPISVDKV